MKRAKLDSTLVRSAGYDRATRTLELEFVSGAIYQYADVPHDDFQSLLEAPSKGRFFHDRIKRTFPCRRVEPAG
jgi:hypothetical protein